MLDADNAFMNTGTHTRHDPSTGGFSTPDVTVLKKTFEELCEWPPYDFRSSDHRSITIILNLLDEQPKVQKRTFWDWKKGNLPTFTNEVDGQTLLECESRKMVDETHAHGSAIVYLVSPKAHWSESGGIGWTVLDDERDQ